MSKREKLKSCCAINADTLFGELTLVCIASEANKVLDSMESKIAELDDAFESCKANLESEKASNEDLLRENNKLHCSLLHAYSQLFKIRMENSYCLEEECYNEERKDEYHRLGEKYARLWKKSSEAYKKAKKNRN